MLMYHYLHEINRKVDDLLTLLVNLCKPANPKWRWSQQGYSEASTQKSSYQKNFNH